MNCLTVNPELFFSENAGEIEIAKAVCAPCEVRIQCLSGALARHEPWGVWGGQLFHAGRPVPFKRGPGRPRKIAA